MDTAQPRLNVEDTPQPKAKVEAGPSAEREGAPKWAVFARLAAQELSGCFSRIANALDSVYSIKSPRLAIPTPQSAGVRKKGKRPILDPQTGEPRKKRREMTTFNLFVQKELEKLRDTRRGESQQILMKEVCQMWRVAPENPNRKLPDGAEQPLSADPAAASVAQKSNEFVHGVQNGAVPNVHNTLAVVATEVKALDVPLPADIRDSEEEASCTSEEDVSKAKAAKTKSEKK